MESESKAATECMRCRQLRTKMDYVASIGRPSGRPAEWDEDQTRGGTAHHYYCMKTMTLFGPDDDLVGPNFCHPDRACYERKNENRESDSHQGAHSPPAS